MRTLITFFVILFTYINTCLSMSPGRGHYLSQDTIYSSDSIIDTSIFITNNIYLENRGTVNGDIYVCSGCKIYLQNSGIISAAIYMGENSDLFQVIKTADDITRIYVRDSNFSILVQSIETLRLSDIMRIAYGADKIILDNANILLTENNTASLSAGFYRPEIELMGETVIEIENAKSLNGQLLLSNVYGEGVVNVNALGLDPLYAAKTFRENGNLYLSVYRETDYQKLIGTDKGAFVNYLRMYSEDNPTVAALDRASTMAELNSIVSKSGTLNPINLINPVRTFNNLEITSHGDPDVPFESGFETIYLVSDSYDFYLGKLTLAASLGKFDIAVSGYAGILDADTDLDEYSAIIYGGSIRTKYNGKSMWIDTTLGFTISDFETGPVLNGTNVKYDPKGLSIYTVSDVGVKFDISNKFYVAPFVGIGAHYDKVLRQSEFELFARGGAVAGFTSEMIGIKSDYQIFANLYSFDVQSLGVKMKYWSVMDMAGGAISYEIIRDDAGISHKISAEVGFMF